MAKRATKIMSKAVYWVANAAVLAAAAYVFWWAWGLPDPRHAPPVLVEVGVPA